MFLLIGGVSILVIPIVARIMHSLVQGARDYVTWIAHFFVQVPAEKNDVSTVFLLIGGVSILVIPIVARCTTDFFLLAFMNPHTIAFM